MKNNIKYNIFALLLALASCLLFYRGNINKLFYPDNYFRTCTDYGQYFIEVKDYLVENTYFKDLFKVGQDPGFYAVTSNLGRITNINTQSILVFFSMFTYFVLVLIVYHLGKKLSQRNSYLTGIVCIFLYFSLYGNIYSNISGIGRQILGTLFFLLFLWSFCHKNNMGFTVAGVLFFAMSLLSHRIFTLVGFSFYFFILVNSFFSNKKLFIKYIYILIITFLLCLPYLIYFSEYLHHYIDYLMLPSSDTVGKVTEKYLGFSFYGPRDSRTPIMHYLFYQGYLLIACVAYFKKTVRFIDKHYLFIFVFLFIYVSNRFDFSVRILLFFEIVMVPIIAINLISHFPKFSRLLIIIIIFLVGFSSISKGALKRADAKKYDENPGVQFLINNINKNKEHFFMASPCGGDLLAQIGYTSHFNFHMGLHNIRQKKAAQEMDFQDLEGIVMANIYLLKRQAVVMDKFKNMDLYIVFINIDKKEVSLLRKGTSDLLGKKYLTLLYPNNIFQPQNGIIDYIFKINTDLITYTDAKAYISRNVDDLNLNIDY